MSPRHRPFRFVVALALLVGSVAGAPVASAHGWHNNPLHTHGSDRTASFAQWVAAGGATPTAPPPEAPPCYGDHAFLAVVAVPAGAGFTKSTASFRNDLGSANALFELSLLNERGNGNQGGELKFVCNGLGTVRVDAVTLPHPASYYNTGDVFARVVGDLQALGYNSPLLKYPVYFNANVPSTVNFCGTGGLDADSRQTPANANNVGPDYAIAWNSDAKACVGGTVETILHELGHTMGAVQLDAPYSNGHWHCWDELDTMCYAEYGVPTQVFCNFYVAGGEIFDCRHDTYASNGAQVRTPGTYLSSHWDIACQGQNYWVVNYASTC